MQQDRCEGAWYRSLALGQESGAHRGKVPSRLNSSLTAFWCVYVVLPSGGLGTGSHIEHPPAGAGLVESVPTSSQEKSQTLISGTPELVWCGGPSSWVLGGAAFLGFDLVVLQGALDQCVLLGSRADWLPSS